MVPSFRLVRFKSLCTILSCFRQIERVLFNKYWPYYFTTLMNSTYAVIWSLSVIYDDGLFLAQFMTRWHVGIVAMHYDPLDDVRWDMWWSLGWLIFYSTTLAILFILDAIPAVSGTAELLGTLILKAFVSYQNLDKFIFIVRIFGFAFHLYAVYCARAITFWVLLYCKFLENLARRWNVRFCFVLGMRKWRVIVIVIELRCYEVSNLKLNYWHVLVTQLEGRKIGAYSCNTLLSFHLRSSSLNINWSRLFYDILGKYSQFRWQLTFSWRYDANSNFRVKIESVGRMHINTLYSVL